MTNTAVVLALGPYSPIALVFVPYQPRQRPLPPFRHFHLSPLLPRRYYMRNYQLQNQKLLRKPIDDAVVHQTRTQQTLAPIASTSSDSIQALIAASIKSHLATFRTKMEHLIASSFRNAVAEIAVSIKERLQSSLSSLVHSPSPASGSGRAYAKRYRPTMEIETPLHATSGLPCAAKCSFPSPSHDPFSSPVSVPNCAQSIRDTSEIPATDHECEQI
jgi:hypothetical protein